MRSIFVSFDDIGLRCLETLINLGSQVTGIFTLDDERRARMSGSVPFDHIAAHHGIPLHKIRNVNDEEVLRSVASCRPDVSFVIGWSQLVKPEFIALARSACVGMHPTLLPKHRGRAPIPWAIISGLAKTGVTMFHIAENADDGDIIGQVEIPIAHEDNAGTLYDKALDAHVALMRQYYPLLRDGKAPRIKQDGRRASSWHKRVPRDGIVDWNTSAGHLYDWVRALTSPYPGAFTFHRDRKLFVWKCHILDEHTTGETEGTIAAVDPEGVVVQAGRGRIRLTSVQLEGEDRLTGPMIARSGMFSQGDRLG
jgi:methionyl-tRNA formyltransferase